MQYGLYGMLTMKRSKRENALLLREKQGNF